MKKLMCAACVAIATGVFAANYYVDAQKGNDTWDGTCPIASASGTSGPRKTLVAAMALAGNGDTVYAAEGTYNEGGEPYGTSTLTNRVIIRAGRRLEASGRRELTIIMGQAGGEKKNANGAGAIRCVLMEGKTSDAPGGIIKGFTITGGYTLSGSDESSDTCGGGVCGTAKGSVDGNGLVVECNLYGNSSGARGPNVAWSTLLRCRVGFATGSFDCYLGTRMIDSLYTGGINLYWSLYMHNCTHTSVGGAWGNGDNFATYNCLFTNPNFSISTNKAFYYRTYFGATQKTGTCYKDSCRFALTAEDLKMSLLDTARPLDGSVVAGQGNLSYYFSATNRWNGQNVVWQKEFNLTDLNGLPRLTDGKINVGCCQYAQPDVYVDAAAGNDANDGKTALTAVKTLTKAMALSVPGDTIHAAAGDYNEGGDIIQGSCSNRVVVLPGRRLLASGKVAATRICGKKSSNTNGCGADAMRCVCFAGSAPGLPGGIVKGFTLKDGRTQAGTSEN